MSDDSWRSNVGDAEIFLLGTPPDEVPELDLPFALYGVDFVLDSKSCLWAIDLNPAPGVRGTGIEEVLSPKEAVESIKARCHELGVMRM